MSEYNYFGVTPADILAAFPGSVASDFSTASAVGSAAIIRELDYAEATVLAMLPSNVVRMLNHMTGLVLITQDVSGVQQVTSPIPLADNNNFAVYSVNYLNPVVDQEFSLCHQKSGCVGAELEQITDATLLSNVITLPSATSTQYISVNADIDIAALNIPELAVLVRAAACCVLGSGLYSREESEWKLVTRFCELAAKEIPENYIPGYFRKFRFLNPLNSGITSIAIRRA